MSGVKREVGHEKNFKDVAVNTVEYCGAEAPNILALGTLVCVRAQSVSRVRLFVTPQTVACQLPLSMGLSRQEYWSGLPFPPPGDLPDPGTEAVSPVSPALHVDSLRQNHWGSLGSLYTLKSHWGSQRIFKWHSQWCAGKAVFQNKSLSWWQMPISVVETLTMNYFKQWIAPLQGSRSQHQYIIVYLLIFTILIFKTRI